MLPSISQRRWNETTAAHLLNRAGFGGTPSEVETLTKLGPEGAVERLLEFTAVPDNGVAPLPEWTRGDPERVERLRRLRKASSEERLVLRRMEMTEQRRRIQELRGWWLSRMASGRRPLEDRLVLFWHGHFATSIRKVRDAGMMARQWETFRRNAAGNWRQMLWDVARDPAMLVWLDQAQSRREHPNENFARELLELFALGEGHYSERDVTEAARALTGLSLDRLRQEYVWRLGAHDDETKVFLGASGRWTPEDILQRIVEHPQSAGFIVKKLWTYFAAESPENKLVEELAAVLRKSNHEFRPLLRVMFRAEAFYAPQVMRSQVKGPVQWLVMATRQLERRLPASEAVTAVLRELGQELFAPPNVKGWDGGVAWINTGTLSRRQQLAAVLVRGRQGLFEMAKNSDGDDGRAARPRRNRQAGGASGSVDLENFFPAGTRLDRDQIIAALGGRFLNEPFRPSLEAEVRQDLGDDPTPRREAILQAIQTVLASTDYQLV
ncbi:MAG: DUF1800 domain-containing protein [Verrucomicrobiales bacterium]|nr:DUF1800 domain-containing protein [Verrucomicrobiales bacterium]